MSDTWLDEIRANVQRQIRPTAFSPEQVVLHQRDARRLLAVADAARELVAVYDADEGSVNEAWDKLRCALAGTPTEERYDGR